MDGMAAADRLELVVAGDAAGQRLDRYLAVRFPDRSRSRWQQLIDDGGVTVNRKAARCGQRLTAGDLVEAVLPPALPGRAEPQPIPLDIVYEDRDLIVVNKPRGMVVHPAAGNWRDTLVNALLYHCSDLSGIGGVMRPGIVHRLDKDTSGLIVAAKNDEAHRRLAAQLQSRTMHREYLAVACGHSPNRQFTVTGPIGRDRRNRLKMSVVTDGKPASTSFTVVEQFSRHCLLKCQLASGRTHQIRVHLAHIGLPVYGDPLYGNRLVGREFGGQALHAARLSFAHPGDGRLLTFTAPLPGCFRQLLDRLRHP